MDFQTEQINAYIRNGLSQGYSDTQLREQFLNQGWTQEAVSQAFAKYYATAAVPSPGPVPLSQPAKRHTPPLLVWIGAGLVAIIVVAVVVSLATSHKAVQKLAVPALKSNAQNTARKNDASAIDAALASYMSNNSGNLPTTVATDAAPLTLDICGTSCTSTDKVTVKLGYYPNTPAAVQFRPYTNSLAVPDVNTVYIVDNATCNSSGSGIGGQVSGQPSAVVLYALQNGSSIQQQCLGF